MMKSAILNQFFDPIPGNCFHNPIYCRKCCDLRKSLHAKNRKPCVKELPHQTALCKKIYNKLFCVAIGNSLCNSHFRISSKTYLNFFLIWCFVISPIMNQFFRTVLSNNSVSFGGFLFVEACHPGRNNNGGARPNLMVDKHLFQLGEYVPKVSEQTIGASGPAKGPIYRNSERYYEELHRNMNPDIVVLNEANFDDRMMTYRCSDKLNILALMVINRWPGSKLRVTKAWSDSKAGNFHPDLSLHYEGRAVDITIWPVDSDKYPFIARLAVKAGFDWVRLKKDHVHCSVKSDSSLTSLHEGCFPGEALVPIPGGGTKRIDDLRPGDEVWSLDASGKIVPDEILMFMDIQRDVIESKQRERLFVSATTENGKSIKLTPNHLIFKEDQLSFDQNGNASKCQSNVSFLFDQKRPLKTVSFAAKLKPGEIIYTVDFSTSSFNATFRPSIVSKVETTTSSSGAFAPLTKHGTIIVDGVIASCYAVVESHKVAHAAMTPIRYFYSTQSWLRFMIPNFFFFNSQNNAVMHQYHTKQHIGKEDEGIMLYAKALYSLGYKILPMNLFFGD